MSRVTWIGKQNPIADQPTLGAIEFFLNIPAEQADDCNKIRSDLENPMAIATTGLPLRGAECAETTPEARTNQRRRISFQAGRALEILGHAIEYLTDEYIHEAKQISAQDPQVQAIQILMALNRQIYYACPVQPTLIERIRAFFHVAPH